MPPAAVGGKQLRERIEFHARGALGSLKRHQVPPSKVSCHPTRSVVAGMLWRWKMPVAVDPAKTSPDDTALFQQMEWLLDDSKQNWPIRRIFPTLSLPDGVVIDLHREIAARLDRVSGGTAFSAAAQKGPKHLVDHFDAWTRTDEAQAFLPPP